MKKLTPDTLTKEQVRSMWFFLNWGENWHWTRLAQMFLNGNAEQRAEAAIPLVEEINKNVDIKVEASQWNGMCPTGKHGLDFQGQECDVCKHDRGGPCGRDCRRCAAKRRRL